jgi:hypothetical protein
MNDQLNELHLAMGQFLTHCAVLEKLMLDFAFVCQPKRFEQVHREFVDNMTFGRKIKELKAISKDYHFRPDHQPHVDKAFSLLDRILPKRNWIVHGETHEVAFDEAAGPIAYRLGIPRGNPEYLSDFLGNPRVAHSFTAEMVRQTIAECDECSGELGTVVVGILTPPLEK